tara:strand:- start:155 stop:289 length:135 start_codon:yes stop_codon:yes gene_type:complete
LVARTLTKVLLVLLGLLHEDEEEKTMEIEDTAVARVVDNWVPAT